MRKSINDSMSVETICDTLRAFKLLYHDAFGYEPAFNRTTLTDTLQATANIVIDTEIITKSTMRHILRDIKKR